jgi:hypothetical protein
MPVVVVVAETGAPPTLPVIIDCCWVGTGFAEGLGKPVIYVCRAKEGDVEKRTHFDANHRHTVRWDLSALDETAKKLKAVIRNTLLGDAKQDD